MPASTDQKLRSWKDIVPPLSDGGKEDVESFMTDPDVPARAKARVAASLGGDVNWALEAFQKGNLEENVLRIGQKLVVLEALMLESMLRRDEHNGEVRYA